MQIKEEEKNTSNSEKKTTIYQIMYKTYRLFSLFRNKFGKKERLLAFSRVGYSSFLEKNFKTDSTLIISSPNDLEQFRKNVSSRKELTKFSVDLEGDDLSRYGKVNLIQVYAIETNQIYIFECKNLSKKDVKSALRPLCEEKNVAKYMFDCRRDIDALYHQYGIKTKGVLDVQLYEVGFRKSSGFGGNKFYHGLYKILKTYKDQLGLSDAHLSVKEKINKQFKQDKFQLDLSEPEVLEYLKIDIFYLEKLFQIFSAQILSKKIKESIEKETEMRENIWRSPMQNAKSEKMAISAI